MRSVTALVFKTGNKRISAQPYAQWGEVKGVVCRAALCARRRARARAQLTSTVTQRCDAPPA